MSKQLNFIGKIAPHAVKAMKETGILASLTIAQACLESGWGDKSIDNNIFGIKAGGSWKGKTKVAKTKEFVNGSWITVNATFRAYDSIEDSIKDHTKLFTTLERYANLRGETDYKRACYLVYKDGYATDPNYPSLLTAIIEQWKLFEYDKQAKTASEVNPKFAGDRELLMSLGITDGSRPKENITREETFAMMARLYRALKGE